jgi:F0F1-type ATP synthase epsilon subunit
MPKHNSTETLNVIARSPFELYFEGEAYSVSATNRIGQFDILPGHADFFSMLTPGEVSIQSDKEPVTIDAKSGIITVRDNQAYLFLNM